MAPRKRYLIVLMVITSVLSMMMSKRVEHLLDEFSAGPSGKVLAPDFSRADIYDDHD